MNANAHRPWMERLAGLGLVLALAVLLLVWPTALLLGTLASTEVVMIGSRFGADEIAANQAFFDPAFAVDESASDAVRARQLREEIASIYGLNPTAPTEVLFVSEADLIRTKEDPSLVLLVRKPGEYVLQRQTVYWFARMITFGAMGAALLLFGVWTILRRRN